MWLVNGDGDNCYQSKDDWLWGHLDCDYQGMYSIKGYNSLSNNEIDEQSEHDSKITYRFGLNVGFNGFGGDYDAFISTQWFEFSIIICPNSYTDNYQR